MVVVSTDLPYGYILTLTAQRLQTLGCQNRSNNYPKSKQNNSMQKQEKHIWLAIKLHIIVLKLFNFFYLIDPQPEVYKYKHT